MKRSLTDREMQLCREYLKERQSMLINQIQQGYCLDISQTDAIGELSSYDNHPADLATELYEREKDLALRKRAEDELERINEALSALAEGTYGLCRVCSMPIDYQRLKANPTADTCLDHAGVTADILRSEFHDQYVEQVDTFREGTYAYDREEAWQALGRYGSSDTPADLYGDQVDDVSMQVSSEENLGVVEDVENLPEQEKSD